MRISDWSSDVCSSDLLARTQKLGRRITGADQAERIRAQLDRAGNPKGWTVDRVSSAKILGTIGGLAAAAYFVLILIPAWPIAVLTVAGLVVLGFFAPNIYLYNTAQKRNEQILKDLPDALDLLTISVEAGLRSEEHTTELTSLMRTS